MKNITIRNAFFEDAETLCALGIQTFRETFDEHNTAEDMEQYLSSTFTKEKLQQELEEKDTVFFLAEEDDEVIGYAKVRQGEALSELGSDRALEIHRIYVAKSHLGKRIGNALMQACLEYAQEAGYEVVWLGVWEHNARAVSFYNKYGFEKFGAHTFVLGQDEQTDWLLKKSIA
ncbi:MAG TPA: GNAT family N-acetyltransferase [Ohtaekwangia sp.]|uniref:GNAT family N-acetyltransferase n=1 Tax=Ohtaekwangia sp. TaxID=2066019 RepID=UPI002F9480BF